LIPQVSLRLPHLGDGSLQFHASNTLRTGAITDLQRLTVSLRGGSERREECLLFSFTGQLDAYSDKQFTDFITDRHKGETLPIVIDLSRIDFLDSSGLGALVQLAKLFNDKIVARANIGQIAGAAIASIHTLPLLIPKGNYSLDFYSTFAKMHGKTHDYKLMYKDINKIFLLNKPDGVRMVYLLQLDQPLRQGMTLHHYIALNFEIDREQKLKINLP